MKWVIYLVGAIMIIEVLIREAIAKFHSSYPLTAACLFLLGFIACFIIGAITGEGDEVCGCPTCCPFAATGTFLLVIAAIHGLAHATLWTVSVII